MCGGELETIPDRDLGDGMRFHAIRDAVQFELNLFHFYKLARERVTQPDQSVVLEWLSETALDHLYELEERYRAILDRQMVDSASDEEILRAGWPFEGIQVKEDSAIGELFQGALEIERRARDHFRQLAGEVPAGLEIELCRELQADAEEDLAMIQTELEQFA
jgi:hypothetical protein